MEISNPFLNVAHQEFQTRLAEVRDYINFVNQMDSSNIDEGVVVDKNDFLINTNDLDNYDIQPATINRDLLKTFRASSYLLLYNLLESTMSEAINSIHETITQNQIDLTDLSEKLHKVILNSLQKGLTNERISQFSKENQDIRDSIMGLGYDKRRLFSGNIDAELIKKYCHRYGFKPYLYEDSSGKRYEYDERTLKEVKRKRNSLAHGSESFINCGQDMIIGSLTIKLDHTEAILLAVFNGLNNFLNNELYLRNP